MFACVATSVSILLLALPTVAMGAAPTDGQGGGATDVAPPTALPEIPPDAPHAPFTLTAQRPIPSFQSWAAAALMPLPPANLPLSFTITDCPQYAYGCFTGSAIILNGATCGFPKRFWRSCRLVFMHELGHAIDSAILNDAERARFMESLHLQQGWYDDVGFGFRPNSAAERFADAWAMCALGSRGFRFRISSSEYDTLVLRANAGRYARLCSLIRSF